uniref:T9SS type B sorting domain-containing protein n=1 Tax=uncultured Polaribacter sp. TaxID=174711 RepID=UPI00260520D9
PISYNVEDNDGNVSNNATVTIDYVPVLTDDESLINTVGSTVTLNIISNDTEGDIVDPTSFVFDITGSPAGTSIDSTGLIATVPGEGVWIYDPGTGTLSFDPIDGFTSDPTAIQYTLTDLQTVSGVAPTRSTPATVTVGYNEAPPVALDNNVSGVVTGVDALLTNISANDTLSDGSAVDTNPTTGNATISIDPNDTDGDGNPLTLDVPNEGVWTYDPITDDLTFNPDPTFTADPTPIVYTLTETITGLSATATASADYVAQAPVATNDSSLNNVPGNLVTVNVTSNDADSDVSGSIDPTTVSLIVPIGTATNVNKDANGDVISFVVPGEGTWFVDALSGSITFTPEVGFTQDPTPIAYTVDDNDGNISNQATVTIGYSPLNIIATNDDFTNSPVNGIEGESLVGNILTSDTGDGFDTLNGEEATRNNVIISIVNPANPTVSGALVPVIDVVTGNISVPAGTPADTYTITYSICDKLEPNPPGNCDTAVVTVVVEAAPIVAEDDEIAGGNGLNGNSNAGNLFGDNGDGDDTLNGVSTNASDVTISIVAPATPKTPGASVPSVDVSTGIISIPPGTPAGDYVINYAICEILNPNNCDTATITVTVDPAKIDAINDDFSAMPINGLDGANTASVLLNDTLNGVLISPADVNLTAGVAPITTSGGLTMNADGTITVAPNTPAGTYVYPYTICEVLNPTNCDTAEATVVVEEAVIDAIVDDYSLSPVNGLDGESNVGNALDNDTLNGIPVVLADVTITIKTPATPIAGAPVPVIDPATGIVSVPAGTPGGTYTIEYTICENLNPNNCDTTTVIVVVDSPAIVAVDNIPVTPVNGFEGKVAVVNVFDNDTLNGVLVNADEVTLKLITADPNNALTLNGDGTVDVAPGTAAGTYELEYQICEVLNPTNCDIAKVIVVVEEAIIVAENDDFSSKPVNSLDGSANVGNVLANNGDGADTLNGSSVDIDAVNLTVISPATPLTPGATVPVIDPSTGIVSVPSGTPAGTYKIGYSICEELNPTNCDDAIVTVVVGTGPIVAKDDLIGNVDGFNGDDNVGNVLTDNGSGSDTLNGVPVLIDEVVISVVTPASPLVSGAPVPTVDPSTGIISVPTGTPGGSYEIEYQICEVLNPVNCTTAIVTVNVKESADLTLLKEVDVNTPNVGDTVNFTITLTNNGLNDATGVNVVDQLPTGYTFVSAVASLGSYSEVSGLWNVDTVTASGNETLIITAIVNASGNYTNTAEVTSSDQEDPTSTPGNSNPAEDDYDDATTTPIKITDLVTTKVVNQSVANVGDIIEFTLNVVNNGPSNATGVSLIENLPSGLTYLSHTAIGGTVNSFASGIWSIGNLPIGGSATITIRAKVNEGEAGNTINNVVTAASGNELDLTTVGDDLEESIYITSADLAVTKIVDDATPNIGNTISYVIEVINNGPDTATNVSLVDNLPVGVTYVSSSTINGTFNNGSGEWSIGDLASGASASLTIEATVNEGTIGKTITNTTSSVVSDQEDPDTTNNIGAVSIVPVGVIDLRLTKTIVNNITTPLVGDKLTFEIRVYNDGPTDATGVQVSELIPSGYKYENYSSTIGTYDPSTGLWNIGKVEVSNTAVLLVDVTVLENGVYQNCAEIIAANEDDKDSTPANGVATEDDYDCASVTPVTELDLSIVKTVVNGNTSPKVGEVITFEIQLTNNGPVNGTDVTVIDNLLQLSYTFVNYSSTVGAYDENTGIWNVGKIAANDIEILLIDVIVEAEGTTTSYTNCATVNSVHQPDVNSANDTSCITLTPIQTVDLELTKDVSENKPVAGSNVDFTVILTNNGLSTANGVEVVDLLPSGYTFVSATTSIGSYNELTGLWTVGTVLKDETQTLTVTATVEAFGDWLNIAEVTAVNELDIDSTPNNGDIYEDDMAQRATEPEVLLSIPEGFTPDGDGKNDVFEIKHLEVLYPKFGMEIVNRYGNVVYKYKHDGNPSTSPKWWNGYSTGRWNLSSDSLPAGTYYYTIYFNNDDRKPQTGWLYLRK